MISAQDIPRENVRYSRRWLPQLPKGIAPPAFQIRLAQTFQRFYVLDARISINRCTSPMVHEFSIFFNRDYRYLRTYGYAHSFRRSHITESSFR